MCRDGNKDTRRTSYLHTSLENSLQPFFEAIAHYALPPFWNLTHIIKAIIPLAKYLRKSRIRKKMILVKKFFLWLHNYFELKIKVFVQKSQIKN